MLTNKNNSLSYLLIFPILFLVTACGTSEESKIHHIQKAKEYFAEKNYAKARVELKNVLQIDPKSAETYSIFGQIEEQNQNWRKSISYYHKAINLEPTILEPHIRLGRFYIQQAAIAKTDKNTEVEEKLIENANEQLEAAFQINPKNIDVLVLKASLLAYQGNDDDSIEILNKVLNTYPTESDAALLLSRIYTHNKLDKKAENALKTAVVSSPDTLDIHIELAKFYAERKQHDNAIKVMKEIIVLLPEDYGHRLTLAFYYIQQKEYIKAEAVYQDAIKAKPDDVTRYITYAGFLKKQKSIEAAISYLKGYTDSISNINSEISFKLASLHRENNDIDQAIHILDNIINKSKFSLTATHARKQQIAIHLAENDIQNTKRLIDKVLEDNPEDHDAILYKGKVSLHENNFKDAITLFRIALNNQPDSTEIMHLLADSHLLNNELHLATDLLRKAVISKSSDVNSRLKLTRFLIASNKNDQALEHVNHVLVLDPDNFSAIALKSDILIQKKKIGEVISLIERLKELAPDNAEGWFRMGRVFKLLNKKDQARREFISAFKKTPDSIDLLAELTDIEMELGEISATITRLQSVLKEQPDHLAAHKFLGMAYLFENNIINAEKELILHIRYSPDDISTYIQLATISYNKKDIHQAVEYYLKARKIAPDNINVLAGLAEIRTIQKKHDEAISIYENILDIQPDNAIAINNLAMTLTNNMQDTRSLKRAKQIINNSASNDHPALLDTLGLINFRLGKYDEAHSVLEKAIAKAPKIPTFHYHMAMVHFKKSNNVSAKKHLQIALGLGNFPERNKAVTALNHLNSMNQQPK